MNPGNRRPFILDVAAKELLFAEKVLFLEGQEDVGLVRKWCIEQNKEVKFDLFGYGVGGFGNYSAYLKLAKDIGLVKVAAIYDFGASETNKMKTDAAIEPAYKLCQLKANDIRDKYRSCGSCVKCSANKQRDCTSRSQYKSGCFDENGLTKPSSSEYKDFCKTFEDVVAYMDS